MTDPRDPLNPPPQHPRPIQPPVYPAGQWGPPPEPARREVFPQGPAGRAPAKTINKKAQFWRLVALVGIPLAMLAGCSAGAAMQAAASEDKAQEAAQAPPAALAGTSAPQTTPPATPAPQKSTQAPAKPAGPPPSTMPPAVPAPTYTDGMYQVGVDIKPGRYRTKGPDAEDIIGMCYWQRLKGDSGEFDDIIANGTPQGAASVTVSKSDEFVEFSGGCGWVKQ